jgi:elongation factor P
MLSYNEIKERKYIVLGDEPYEVISSHVFRKQQRKPVNQTKLRNLVSGSIRAETFHATDTVKEADLEYSKVKYLFKKPNRQDNTVDYWFCDIKDPSNRFELSGNVIGDNMKFIKENMEVDSLVFNEEIIGIKVPIKVELKVVEAPPAVRGNTATGANKQITLETGLVVNAPIFIEEGESVVVNTDKCEYVERVK